MKKKYISLKQAIFYHKLTGEVMPDLKLIMSYCIKEKECDPENCYKKALSVSEYRWINIAFGMGFKVERVDKEDMGEGQEACHYIPFRDRGRFYLEEVD